MSTRLLQENIYTTNGCGIGQPTTALLASFPAVLSGTACCGPVVLILVDIQTSGALLTTFQLLLPFAMTQSLPAIVIQSTLAVSLFSDAYAVIIGWWFQLYY